MMQTTKSNHMFRTRAPANSLNLLNLQLSRARRTCAFHRTLTCSAAEAESIEAAPNDSEPPKIDTRAGQKWIPTPLSDAHIQRNATLVSKLQGKLILAPLTRGGNLPFRRLCGDFGAEVTMSEMAFARHLLKGDPKEKALLKRASNEKCFGFQIATNQISEGARIGDLAQHVDFIDLNCGCPIKEATRRGLGSVLLRKPQKLARLVAGIAEQLPDHLPLTVKIRTGSDNAINVKEVVQVLRDAGAAAVTIHGRTAMQFYTKPADWGLIEEVTREEWLPVIGNGDVLTMYEARRRMSEHGCLAVMVGRGALIKPWIFQEHKTGVEFHPTAEERVGIYRNFVSHMKDHFGADDKGKGKSFYFLPWHLGFFSRYRPLPESVFAQMSAERPLINTRWDGVATLQLGETVEDMEPLERLLRCEAGVAHENIAEILWESGSDGEAVAQLKQLAERDLSEWEAAAVVDRENRQKSRDERQAQG